MPASRNWSLSLYKTMSDRDILAGVIQGEAASAQGQFDVAAVISNRLNGIGSDRQYNKHRSSGRLLDRWRDQFAEALFLQAITIKIPSPRPTQGCPARAM